LAGRRGTRKAAGFQRLPGNLPDRRRLASEPLGPALVGPAVAVITVAVKTARPAAVAVAVTVETPVHAALEAVLAPALGPEPALHMGQ